MVMGNVVLLKEQPKMNVTYDAPKYNRIFPSKMSTTSFLEIYILHLLSSNKHYYGKELLDEIEATFGSKWKPSHGMLYPLLRELEKKKLIKGNWEDPSKKTKKLYKITKAGLEALEREKADKENMFIDSYNMVVKILNVLYGHSKPYLINRI